MEYPVRFDIWGTVFNGRHDAVKLFLESSRNMTLLDINKMIHNASNGKLQLLLPTLTWNQVGDFMGALPDWIDEVRVYQEGYTPSDQVRFCDKHKLWYGGCLGCHICRGFFA